LCLFIYFSYSIYRTLWIFIKFQYMNSDFVLYYSIISLHIYEKSCTSFQPNSMQRVCCSIIADCMPEAFTRSVPQSCNKPCPRGKITYKKYTCCALAANCVRSYMQQECATKRVPEVCSKCVPEVSKKQCARENIYVRKVYPQQICGN
jgi:hypothetical protein